MQATSESASSANKFDGDGRLVWTSVTTQARHGERVRTVYYLDSTVLGGAAVAELNNSGQKTKGYVYAGGRKLAEAVGGNVTWSHQDPVTGSRSDSYASGYVAAKAEFNADGVDIGFSDPALTASEIPAGIFERASYGLDSSCSVADPNCTTCYLDGFEHSCGQVAHLLESGAAAQCPNNDCGPRNIQGKDDLGNPISLGWAIFNGSGYWISDGSSSENLFFDDLEWGSALDAMAYSFSNPGQGKKKQRKAKVDTSLGQLLSEPTLRLVGFDTAQEERIRQTLNSIQENSRCAAAFAAALGIQPAGLIAQGIVIAHAGLLFNPDETQRIGISENARQRAFKQGAVGSEGIQAFTFRNNYGPGYPTNDTVDPRARVLLNASAFSVGTYSLREVLVHELLHVAGWPPSGWLRSKFNRTDLSHYDKYDEVMAACK